MNILESRSEADDGVSEALFRKVMASFVTGVTVITTQVRGEVRGMTANAFMSGSLEPPLCVICVAKKARMHGFLVEADHFGVNILARGQESLIGHFAGRPVEDIHPQYRYAGDTPLLAHANATIAAKVAAMVALRRSLAVYRSYLRVTPCRRCHPDRPACRSTGFAPAFARTNNLADA
jgi:flavin reductase (DIM6/NTAB) family NADH-FMN oxidoreductase RutF